MGREFIDIFEDWAPLYDDSVTGKDAQYEKVFEHYDQILSEVVEKSLDKVLEFGVGTGNLTNQLLKEGKSVIGIEPSSAMRKIAQKKIPDITILDGDFINFPKLTMPINSIVSTYAFHHLTDEEKKQAIKQFHEVLQPKGMVVFGDTMFETIEAKQKQIDIARKKGFKALAEDLEREYYPIIETVRNAFEKYNFHVSFKQMNDFVWIISAIKIA
ncbi:class I SAM-dependent DNA methyltransferase [Oceanobacillus kimchii]|uniref:class I SAM-dependent DNA methyltransferase n=1 Tax=Oceanobacillus kimchii TaxID=746691 RepID=UPI00034AFC11|nr:class I SAM-dependent methyltransferase [Oceanobacillus kimchii]